MIPKFQCGCRPDAHAIQHPWTALNGRGFMVSADWIAWVTVTTLIIRAIHLMEWKAVLSCNAFLPSKFPICMQLLFRITVLSTMSHIEIWPSVEEVQERERETFNGAMWIFKLAGVFERIKIAIARACANIVKANVTFVILRNKMLQLYKVRARRWQR